MNKNKLVILGLIASALLVIGVVSKNKKRRSIVEIVNLQKLLPADIKQESIGKIVVEVPKDAEGLKETDGQAKTGQDKKIDLANLKGDLRQLTLVKQAESWVVSDRFNAGADKSKVEQFFQTLGNLKGELRSDSKDVIKDYELDEKHAMKISLYKPGATSPNWVLFGGKKADYRTHFVRLNGSNKVYVIEKDMRSEVGATSGKEGKGPDYKKFVDLKLYHLDDKDVAKITLNSNLVDFQLVKETIEIPVEPKKEAKDAKKDPKAAPQAETKKTDIWKVVSSNISFLLKEGGVKKLLSTLKGVQAKEIVAGAEEAKDSRYGMGKGDKALIIETKSGTKWVFKVGNRVMDGSKETDEYHVQVDEKSAVFTVGKFNVNDVFTKQSDLFDLEVLKLDSSQIVEINISGKNNYTLKREGSDNKWRLVGLAKDKKVKPGKLNDLVKAFSKISAHGIAAKISELAKEQYRAVLKAKDGNQYQVAVDAVEQPGQTFMARLSGQKQNVLIEESTVKSLFPKKDDLIE